METNIIGNNKYKLIKKIGSGTFGTIFEGINVRTNEKVAIKMELISDNVKLLKNESIIYKNLNGIIGVPNIKWYGKNDLYYFMVIDLLGDSLEKVVQKRKLHFKIVMQIGASIINILKHIHERGFIHRDIKPENFLLTTEKPKKIHIIDFGLTKPYMINGSHIDYKQKQHFMGTPDFSSINAHNFCEQSRRDDLESLSYTLIYLHFGTLDWIENDVFFFTQQEKNDYIKGKKEEIVKNNNIPLILMEYHKSVRSLGFDETPDYEKYLENFKKEILRLNESLSL